MVLNELRQVARRIPGLRPLVHRARVAFGNLRPRNRVFREIYEHNEWRGAESVSGTGSDDPQTLRIRQELPPLWQRHQVRRLVDAPCGDFRWMRHIVSGVDEYVGVDIVEPLIRENEQRHGSDRVHFLAGDLINDPLPAADMILCRDCFVHLSFGQIRKAVRNMQRSGITYLLTTTFPEVGENVDIPTGEWRPLNLERGPFHFPAPLEIVNEGCTEFGGRYADKSLALWRLADL